MQRIVNRNDQLNTQTQLSYINSFGLHNIDALLGFETQDTEYAFNYMAGQDYPGDLYELTNAGSTSAETNRQSYRMTSFLGRANYNYADRYYLGLSYRTDGSSRLAREIHRRKFPESCQECIDRWKAPCVIRCKRNATIRLLRLYESL